VLDAARRDGDLFWYYTNCTRSYSDVMRMKAGFFFWKIRASGQTYYTYRQFSDSPFSDLDGRGRDHLVTYPGLDGPVRTVHWECHREGVDDTKYAYTLEATLAEARRRRADAGVLAAAEKVLADLRESVNVDLEDYAERYPAPKYAFHFYCDWTPEQFDAARQRIVQAILELRAAM
jgi:hypothetical protein